MTNINDVSDMSIEQFANTKRVVGSIHIRAVENGPLIYVFNYEKQRAKIRSDKRFSLWAAEDILPGTIIAHYEGDIVQIESISEDMQSIVLCNGDYLIRPNDDNFKVKHIAWCANDSRFEFDKKSKNNAKISGYGFIRNGKRTAISLISTKKIYAKTEIFCNYGKTYSVVKKANDLRKNPTNNSLSLLHSRSYVKVKREREKEIRKKKGFIELKRGRPKKGTKYKKVI